MFAPITDLIAECGETKASKHTGTKKSPWCWYEIHQRAFDNVEKTVGCDAMLAYPDYSRLFHIYTDTSTRQLGAVVVKNNRPIDFLALK